MSVLLLDSISKVAKVSCPKNKGLYGFQGILSFPFDVSISSFKQYILVIITVENITHEGGIVVNFVHTIITDYLNMSRDKLCFQPPPLPL